jgi:O-antigen ligase
LNSGWKLNGSAAGVDFRFYFYYWAGALYFMSFSYSKELLDKILKVWFWMCLVLLAIVYFRFVAEFLHMPMAQEWIKDDPTGIRFRVIKSERAYLLSVTIIMLFVRFLLPEVKKPSKIITSLFVLAVIVLQHRSVWAATIFAIAGAGLFPGIKTSRMFANLLIIAVVGAIVLTPLMYFGYGDSFLSSVNHTAELSNKLNSGTFGARLKGWEGYLDIWQRLSTLYQFFGEPMAGSPGGLKEGLHNFYLQVLSRVGIFGLGIIILTYLLAMLKLFINSISFPADRMYYALFFMLLIGQLAFYIPYSNQPEHGIILGIAMSLASKRLTKVFEKSSPNTADTTYFLNTSTSSSPNNEPTIRSTT